jgi:hypothetical protein
MQHSANAVGNVYVEDEHDADSYGDGVDGVHDAITITPSRQDEWWNRPRVTEMRGNATRISALVVHSMYRKRCVTRG